MATANNVNSFLGYASKPKIDFLSPISKPMATPPAPVIPQATPQTPSIGQVEFDDKDIEAFKHITSQGVDPEEARTLIIQAKGGKLPTPPTLGDKVIQGAKDVVSGFGKGLRAIPETILEFGQSNAEGKIDDLVNMGLLDPDQAEQAKQKITNVVQGIESQGEIKGANPESGLYKGAKTVAELAQGAEGLAEVPKLVRGGIKLAKGLVKAPSTVENVINPLLEEKTTVGNLEKAGKEGRVIKPEQGVLQKTKIMGKPILTPEPVKIAPTKVIKRADQVIKTRIPNSEAMDAPELLTAVQQEGPKMAKELRPKLEKIKVKGLTKARYGTINKLNDEFLNNPAYEGYISNAEKLGMKKAIKRIKNARNAADLWDARIEFDTLTPQTVRKGSMTDAKVEAQHQLWLKIRGEMNNLIEDTASKFSDVDTKNTFLDMSSLYDAQLKIVKNLPEDVKVEKGILSADNLLKWGFRAGVGYLGLEGGRKILGL